MKHRRCNAPEKLQKFVIQRNKLRQRTKKPKLTPEDYEADIQKFNNSDPLARILCATARLLAPQQQCYSAKLGSRQSCNSGHIYC